MEKILKPVRFVGASRRELRVFPEQARAVAGESLYRLQLGALPRDWKPIANVGSGACEIRVRTDEGGSVQHRVIYVARFPEAVYVLHAFEKKAQQIPEFQIELAAARYNQMLRERNANER